MIKLSNYKSVGDEIRQIRLHLGLSQNDFAKLYNRRAPTYTRTTAFSISRYERNLIDPPASKFIKFLALRDKE